MVKDVFLYVVGESFGEEPIVPLHWHFGIGIQQSAEIISALGNVNERSQ
jgi:hypothetical protein